MKSILLVDDSKAVRMVGKRVMTALGFTHIYEAEHGQQALAVVLEQPHIDAILLDWNMPVMDGITFLKELRKLDMAHQPIVVMCTTENDFSHIAVAMESGANEYIMKPFTEDIVRDKFVETGLISG